MDSSSSSFLRQKVLIVGDGACGKTSLLVQFTRDYFPDDNDYVPTVFENYTAEMMIDSKMVNYIMHLSVSKRISYHIHFFTYVCTIPWTWDYLVLTNIIILYQ